MRGGDDGRPAAGQHCRAVSCDNAKQGLGLLRKKHQRAKENFNTFKEGKYKQERNKWRQLQQT